MFHSPPTSSPSSKPVHGIPNRCRLRAAASPEGPAPITAYGAVVVSTGAVCRTREQPCQDGRVLPMLATKGDHVPSGAEWTHEVKWDGMRVLVDRTPDRLRIFSRNENDVTVS